MASGASWLAMAGEPDGVRLEADDRFLLSSGRPFRLASDLPLSSRDAGAVFPAARDGVATCNGSRELSFVSSRFALAGPQGHLLLDLLPPAVHVRGDEGRDALGWSIERMAEELRGRHPGGHLMAEHLAHIELVWALRWHLEEGCGARSAGSSRSRTGGW